MNLKEATEVINNTKYIKEFRVEGIDIGNDGKNASVTLKLSDSEDIVTLDIYIIKSYLVFSCKMRAEYSRTIDTEPMKKIYKINLSSNLAGIVLDGNSVPWAESAILAAYAEEDEIIEHVSSVIGLWKIGIRL